MLEDSSAMLRETARRFATQRLAPNAARWDEEGKCPNEVIAEMGRLGLLGMTIPEAYGGVGASYEDFMAVMEEIAAGDGGVSTIMHVHQFGGAAPTRRRVAIA